MTVKENLMEASYQFATDMLAEVARARAKFPAPNPTLIALMEEVGELSQAALHIREGKPGASWKKVRAEAIQVAVMALRMATEGDGTIGVKPDISEITP